MFLEVVIFWSPEDDLPNHWIKLSGNSHLQIKPEEVKTIVNDFANPGSLAPTGLFIEGTKYMVIQGEPRAVIRGKKVATK